MHNAQIYRIILYLRLWVNCIEIKITKTSEIFSFVLIFELFPFEWFDNIRIINQKNELIKLIMRIHLLLKKTLIIFGKHWYNM